MVVSPTTIIQQTPICPFTEEVDDTPTEDDGMAPVVSYDPALEGIKEDIDSTGSQELEIPVENTGSRRVTFSDPVEHYPPIADLSPLDPRHDPERPEYEPDAIYWWPQEPVYDTSLTPTVSAPKPPLPNTPIAQGGILPMPGASSHRYNTRSKQQPVNAHMRCLAAHETDIDHHLHTDFGTIFYLGVHDQDLHDAKSSVEFNHYDMFAHALRINRMNYKDDPSIPRFFYQAMQHAPWVASVNKEQLNLEKHLTFWIEDDVGQPRIPLMWIFEIKDDGTLKSRLVGRGDMMKAGIHYQDGETYCGNVSASSIDRPQASRHAQHGYDWWRH